MGKLDPNSLIGLLRGKLGDLVFVPTKDGAVIVKHRPVRNAEFTPAELETHSAFRRAAAYVKRARQQPDLYGFYQALGTATGKRACDLAHSDCRHPPVIEDVMVSSYGGHPGDVIGVRATDNVGVISVVLTLRRLDGLVLEQGPAQPELGSAWGYTGQTAIPGNQTIWIEVVAMDRPGNATVKGLHHALE
jgi:hypothetical protein